jgi:eukaryotic-like serine/threonine-protein kinase
LRALAQHPDVGETYATIGILRLNQGETRAAVRAFQESVTRVPLLAEAHEYLGRLLCEAGRVEEGMRRLDLALRLEPESVNARWERARTLALLGDRAAADLEITRATAIAGNEIAGVYPRIRFALWWQDRPIAGRVVRVLEDTLDEPDAISARPLMPMLKAITEGQSIDGTFHYLQAFTNLSAGSPRQRAFYWQLNTEFFCVSDQLEEAFEALEKSAALTLNDLLWLDRCPPLAKLRDDPRFARIRALVAARVAEIFA